MSEPSKLDEALRLLYALLDRVERIENDVKTLASAADRKKASAETADERVARRIREIHEREASRARHVDNILRQLPLKDPDKK